MVKSSQQCRTRKGPRQGGGLVVVNQRHLSREAPGPPPKPTKGKKKKKNGALTLGELMASGNDSEDFDTSPPTPPPPGGVAKYVFSSTHHTLEQRLYYLLATRPSQPKHLAGVHHHHHHQPGGGGSVDGSSAAAAAAVEGGCHAVVFVENTAVAQELIGMLKALSLTAYAVHDRTPKAQAQEHIKRFLAAPSAERSSVLVLTNAALARSPPSVGPVKPAHGPFLRIVHFDAPEGEKNAAARGRVAKSFSRGRGARTVEEVYLGGEGRDTVALAPFSFDGAGMGFIRSRLIVAKKLSKAVALSAGEGEDRGMQRAATAAGLEWDGDAGQSDTGAAAAKREKRRAHAQQAAALRQKVSVLLCQPLLPQPSSAATSTTTASSKTAVQQSSKELRKKMAVLGMIHGPQGGAAGTPLDDAAGAGGKDKGGAGAGAPEERAAAQTRWLDGCNGEVFGGAWAGSVRRGASCDCTSREVRARVEAAKRAGRGGGGSGGGGGKGGAGLDATTAALAKWNPNPDTPDPERWGGRWGKPCGHNEVCALCAWLGGGAAAPPAVRPDGGRQHPSLLEDVARPGQRRLRRLPGAALPHLPGPRASPDRLGRDVVRPHRRGRGVLVVAEAVDVAPLFANAALPDEEHEGLHGVRRGSRASQGGGESGYPLGRLGSEAVEVRTLVCGAIEKGFVFRPVGRRSHVESHRYGAWVEGDSATRRRAGKRAGLAGKRDPCVCQQEEEEELQPLGTPNYLLCTERGVRGFDG